jgi:hypothetical protein
VGGSHLFVCGGNINPNLPLPKTSLQVYNFTFVPLARIKSEYILKISLSEYYGALLTASGETLVFGFDIYGQMGLGYPPIYAFSPIQLERSAFKNEEPILFAAGGYHSLVITRLLIYYFSYIQDQETFMYLGQILLGKLHNPKQRLQRIFQFKFHFPIFKMKKSFKRMEEILTVSF